VNPPRHSIFIQCGHSQSPNMGKFFRSPCTHADLDPGVPSGYAYTIVQ
jgi:hypothetical protein